jgi:GH15 family glucan-1,4-alpha-glucosidase
MPRFDSPSIFASILADSAGHWSIRPVGDFKMLREYVEGSMVLRTVFHTSGGILELRDALSLGDTQDPHRLGGSGVDGLEGQEGTFLLCTFWLAQALAMAGRKDEGAEAFERAIGYINDVGLLAEQVDSATGELLGNFPQAFSHIGLVNAAWALDQLGP